MTDNTSPRPWSYEYDNDTGPADDYIRRFWTLRDANGDRVGEAPTQELAVLIVAAVNSYDAMREALNGLLDIHCRGSDLEEFVVNGQCVRPEHVAARAALAAGEG